MSSLIELPGRRETVGLAQVTSRQTQEVQAAMTVAKRFPRDQSAALARILDACRRPTLAEVACYEYAKGGTKVSGPSIRLAEMLAQNWGNLDFGLAELDRYEGDDGVGVSLVQACCWDLETNVRAPLTFNVRHWRDTKSGGYKLTDEREIYELIANQGARRLRARILAIIPGDIVDAAVEACERTLAGPKGESLGDSVAKMLTAFSALDVTRDMIEAKLQHAAAAITASELAKLRKIYNAIRDGFGEPSQYFGPGATDDEPAQRKTVADAIAAPADPKPRAKKAEQPPADKPAASTFPPADAEPFNPQTDRPAATEDDFAEFQRHAAESMTLTGLEHAFDRFFGQGTGYVWTHAQSSEGLRIYEIEKRRVLALREQKQAAKKSTDALFSKGNPAAE